MRTLKLIMDFINPPPAEVYYFPKDNSTNEESLLSPYTEQEKIKNTTQHDTPPVLQSEKEEKSKEKQPKKNKLWILISSFFMGAAVFAEATGFSLTEIFKEVYQFIISYFQ